MREERSGEMPNFIADYLLVFASESAKPGVGRRVVGWSLT